MTEQQRSPGRFGPDGEMRATWPARRTVLAVVHHLAAGSRLKDVLPLIETDPRVQVLYTAAPHAVFPESTLRYLRELDACHLPWREAVTRRFDLAVAAGHGHLERVGAPVLALSHGIGPVGALVPRMPGYGPEAARPGVDAVAGTLVSYGRVIPAAIGVAHEEHRAVIARAVPEAAGITHIVGDPCYDRILASLRHRAGYRGALDVIDGQRLVVVSSTWGANSLLGRCPDLPGRLVAELPRDRYQVVLAPHPWVWAWHGRRQLRAWLSRAQRDGLRLLPPEEGWRAALVAADLVIGDHGSVTGYALALGRPVLLGAFPDEDVAAGSPLAALGRIAPRLRGERSLAAQVARAVLGHDPAGPHRGAFPLTSAPGRSAALLRELMYRMMGLEEPEGAPSAASVPLPRPLPPLPGVDGERVESGRRAA